mgnify:CR=1 FL=1
MTSFISGRFNWSVILLVCLSVILIIRIISDLGGGNHTSILSKLSLSPVQVSEIRQLKETYQPKLSRYEDRLLDSSKDILEDELHRESFQNFLDDYYNLHQLKFRISFEIYQELNSKQKEIFKDYLLSRLHSNFNVPS